MSKPKIAVIISSIRPTRFGDKPAKWIADHVAARGDADVEIVDLKDYPLPLFDAAASDFWMPTPNETAAKWQAKLNEFDGYIVVTAEYNRSITGALKNAIDWAYKPFMKKAVAFVGYGSVGGARAIEHLRNIMVELQAVPVRHAVHIGGSDFIPIMMGQKSWDDSKGNFDPFVPEMLDNLLWWTNATRTARQADAAAAAKAA
ncbi:MULTISPECIES: NAD(P)H-dependent oxidoreductase [unclassified Devosia]|jgi:NAD(P)H-dependent FMN reductase|uniref:NADPH-dependent FMN reductase n=1 Tax=unclassified Devosia TaxID=196773 RepID=UPI00086C70F9|nr:MULTISPECIES: NAD(P)H-dependent oxidoreductase [unclassified Devosia]MBN9363704.1 NAD(P)H-dependent oxidoreductase [Devosia sp.]ODS84608.1 MAG: FMN reductase [Devosia sp. SCN 66-27]OJX26996.1 MAG: FMN reductase [Devosia sp. 66-14]